MTREERDTLREAIDRHRRHLCGINDPTPRAPARPRRSRRVRARRQAGERNIDAMRRAFERLGTATQAQAAQTAGVRSGTSTWAVRALVEEGAIVATGRRHNRSPEYAVRREP